LIQLDLKSSFAYLGFKLIVLMFFSQIQSENILPDLRYIAFKNVYVLPSGQNRQKKNSLKECVAYWVITTADSKMITQIICHIS